MHNLLLSLAPLQRSKNSMLQNYVGLMNVCINDPQCPCSSPKVSRHRRGKMLSHGGPLHTHRE